MLTRHRDRSFIHASKKRLTGQWAPVCAPRTWQCTISSVNTLYPGVSSYHWYCGWLPYPCINCQQRSHSLTPVCARMQTCISFNPSWDDGSDASALLWCQLEVAISSPWKPVWCSNWRMDLHGFDYNFFLFNLCWCCACGSERRSSRACCFVFLSVSLPELFSRRLHNISVFVKQENRAS